MKEGASVGIMSATKNVLWMGKKTLAKYHTQDIHENNSNKAIVTIFYLFLLNRYVSSKFRWSVQANVGSNRL